MYNLEHHDRIAIDTETTGLSFIDDAIFGISIATPTNAWYIDTRHQPEEVEKLRKELSSYTGTVAMFNAKFDWKFLYTIGIKIPFDNIVDVAIQACIIDENLGRNAYTLDALASRYLGERKVSDIYEELASVFGGKATRNQQMPNLHLADPQLVAPYAIRDAELTLKLFEVQHRIINHEQRHKALWKIAGLEQSLIQHVVHQEMTGVRVDLDYAEQARTKLHTTINDLKKQLDQAMGKPFNPNSSPQVIKYFNPKKNGNGEYVLSCGVKCKTTEKGNPSIDNEVLLRIAEKDPIADKIIEIRRMIKTADTFLGKHVLGHAKWKGGSWRVHPNINQTASSEGGTKTGRFSYTDPALQQIPNRNRAVASIVKPCFLPDEGHMWVEGDLNSFEVRVFASLVGRFNRELIDVYTRNPDTDFHGWVADLMSVPRNPRPDGGPNAKQLNLSMIFNSGKGSIAKQLGYSTTQESFVTDEGEVVVYDKPCAEAEQIINLYYNKVIGVRELAARCKNTIMHRGWIRTEFGRVINIPNKRFAYKASGLLIQATSADINKHNWLRIINALGDDGRLILNTHDSYSMSIREDKVKEVWNRVKDTVEQPIINVPITLDYKGSGVNWWASIKGDK